MTTPPMQDPQQAGGAPQAQGAPSQAPASPDQMMLAQIFQALQRLSQSNPAMAPGLAKAAQGIQEAQTAAITQPQQTPSTQNPAY